MSEYTIEVTISDTIEAESPEAAVEAFAKAIDDNDYIGGDLSDLLNGCYVNAYAEVREFTPDTYVGDDLIPGDLIGAWRLDEDLSVEPWDAWMVEAKRAGQENYREAYKRWEAEREAAER
jgi:hypothetical protein